MKKHVTFPVFAIRLSDEADMSYIALPTFSKFVDDQLFKLFRLSRFQIQEFAGRRNE